MSEPTNLCLSIDLLPGVGSVARDEWNAFFPDRAEDWSYFKACEESGSSEFELSALVVRDNGQMIAAAPLFRTLYRIDTSLPQSVRPMGEWLNAHAPGLLRTSILGIGSPWTEECPIGFHPRLADQEKGQVLRQAVSLLGEHASRMGVSILSLKDMPDANRSWAGPALQRAGFIETATLPVATLHLPLASEDEYVASLRPKMRADIRSKMRKSAEVSIAYHQQLDPEVARELHELFEETRSRRKADYGSFDDVPPGFFTRVMATSEGRAGLMTCHIGGVLASFNLFMREPQRIIGKYIGMRYPLARDNNLYFVNWMEMVRRCIAEERPWLQAGQTGYGLKVRLGCQLRKSWIYFRHVNNLANAALRLAAPYCGFDAMDPDLRAMGENAPYIAGD